MSHPSDRESAIRCRSLRCSPAVCPGRSPTRASNSSVNRSRAERQDRNIATTSSSLARSTSLSGSWSRCRARSR